MLNYFLDPKIPIPTIFIILRQTVSVTGGLLNVFKVHRRLSESIFHAQNRSYESQKQANKYQSK